MSLEKTGVWQTGVWATTVWGDGVWFEGSVGFVLAECVRKPIVVSVKSAPIIMKIEAIRQ